MTAPTNVSTCYRHPDRVAGIRCQRCDRPICPSCMNQASVGFHCPECSSRGAQREYRGVASLRQQPLVMQVLIGLNVLVFLADMVLASSEPSSTGGRILTLGGWDRVQADGVLIGAWVPEEPWRLVTSGFLHANIIHLGVNMWSLYIIGRLLEPAVGRARFAAIYAASLLAGSLGVVLLSPESATVGASGAIFGLMGALLAVAVDRKIDLVRSGLLGSVGFSLLFTFLVPNISIGGHLGGLAGGFLAGLVATKGARLMGRRAELVSSAVIVAGGLACGLAAYVLMQARYG